MNSKTLRTTLLAAGIALAFGSTAVQAEKLVFGVSASQGSLQYRTAEKFAEVANEKFKQAGLDYNVAFFGDAQLGKDKELMQKLKLGTVAFTQPSSTMPTVSPEFALWDMPFLVKDRAHLNKIEQEVFWPKIAPTVEDKGYKVISLWENGFRQMTSNAHPINSPADLSGIKMRTPNSTWRVSMFREWGGNPTPMAFSEVFVALQTGVIDGQENPLTNIYAAKLQEVQKYLSLTNHVYTPSYLVAGKRTWDKLPDAVREVIKSSAEEIRPWMYDTSDKEEAELLDTLKQGGMQVNTADRAAFVEASKPIYQQFAAEVPNGEALLDQALKLADAS
ncbi:TRAP-type C4-dicarboxylate transport system, periplasmic component [Marinobacterium lacunae]|uniref:TRAP-type C4-dicarboxylate transport system, periplasmic component n=1 Tax=Marinobacterium lacunae TaxID=1232683 RepID=A0A081FZL1_9GAMM|nr:TRAP transporter substrate-binding protein [Marinobacterium lacunae]KEA63966.1 TRAP-type C4-dicarboxylate transport system, periplasmic component [Marinobacterium lacunae]